MTYNKLIDSGFHIIIASAREYEALTAEIYFNGKYVALVSQEKGIERMNLEFPGIDLDESSICREVDMKGFIWAVEVACKSLRGEPE